MSLKQKTISGLIWSFVDTATRFFLSFFVGIILSRLLSPEDYGLVGMTTIFISISKVFIDSGFSDSLIREIEPTKEEYSTILYTNISLGIFFYIMLFFSAPLISQFFNQSKLSLIIRIVSLDFIISSTTIVHYAMLRKRLDFKTQAIVKFVSTIISGIIAILMALKGYGVWSLVSIGIVSGIISSILLWLLTGWVPKWFFSFRILKHHFNFGSKIMLGSFINIIYNNMFYVLIGKIFSPAELGFFTKANSLQRIPSTNIDIIIRQVTYPVLATIRKDDNRLKNTYKVLIRMSSFLSFIIMFLLIAIAKALIITLIGVKWLPSVPLLQLLCFTGVFFPLISINANVLNVKGRSDLSLNITILNLIFAIPAMVFGYLYGISALIIGIIIGSICIYVVVMVYSKSLIKYTVKEQLVDVWSAIKIASAVSIPVFFLGKYLVFNPVTTLFIQLIFSFVLFFLFGEIFKNKEYFMLKSFLFSKIKK